MIEKNLERIGRLRQRIYSCLQDRYGEEFFYFPFASQNRGELYEAEDAHILVNKGGREAERVVKYFMFPLKSASLQLQEMDEALEPPGQGWSLSSEGWEKEYRHQGIDGSLLLSSKEYLESADRPVLCYNLEKYIEEPESFVFDELIDLELGVDRINEAYSRFIEEDENKS